MTRWRWKMIYLTMVVSLLPGVASLAVDPDLLGIIIFIVHALLVYIAWRLHIIGGIILILLAATWLGLLIYNATLGPMRFYNILLWMVFAACPLAGGILFIRLGKRKRESPLPPTRVDV
jgi:hypothetical protein